RRRPEYWGDGGGGDSGTDFFDLKGVVQALTDDLHLPEVSYRKSSAPYLHPGRAAELLVGGRAAGGFGELHPKVAESFGLAGRAVLAGGLDLEAILEAGPGRYSYTRVRRFRAALRDGAVIVDEAVPAEEVERQLRAAGGGLLRGVRLFDVYRGESIPAGKKSLAYALTYQADDRTLTD